MTGSPLLVHGGVLIDDLLLADGRAVDGVLGGAALHALAGAALWDDDVLLLGGVGEDAEEHILPWMRQNGLSTDAVRVAGPFTPRNALVYRDDGGRSETPVHGAEHFAALQPGAHDLASRLPGARGAFVFHDADPLFWRPVLQAARETGALLLWELSGECCTPGHRQAIALVAGGIAAISLNLDEAKAVFGNKPVPELVREVRALGAEVSFLRCGPEGSVVITVADATSLRAEPGPVVDVTGAGNTYGGAALAGLAAEWGPLRAGRMAALAARLAIAQHGLFPPRDAAVRRSVHAALEAS